jgi:hypothetical protein
MNKKIEAVINRHGLTAKDAKSYYHPGAGQNINEISTLEGVTLSCGEAVGEVWISKILDKNVAEEATEKNVNSAVYRAANPDKGWEVVVRNTAGGPPFEWETREECDSEAQAIAIADRKNKEVEAQLGVGGYGNIYGVRSPAGEINRHLSWMDQMDRGTSEEGAMMYSANKH